MKIQFCVFASTSENRAIILFFKKVILKILKNCGALQIFLCIYKHFMPKQRIPLFLVIPLQSNPSLYRKNTLSSPLLPNQKSTFPFEGRMEGVRLWTARTQVAQSLNRFQYNMDLMQRTNNRNYAIYHRTDVGQYSQVYIEKISYCIEVVQPKPVSKPNGLAKLIHLTHFTLIIHFYTP